MALTLGTNCGFVTAAPSGSPGGSSDTIDNRSYVIRDTSPASTTKVTEIGWYCYNATEEANYEVGIYDTDGAVVPGEAGTRLFLDNSNAKGTDAGWKRATVDFDIDASTTYWIAVQCDNTSTTSNILYEPSGGSGIDSRNLQSSLPDPYGGGSFDSDGMVAIYALVETSGGGGADTPVQINIGDVWKEVAGVQINIGDSWKAVAGMQINIGDSWKTIF